MAVLLPGMIYLVYRHAHPDHRRFAVPLWGATALAIISAFVLVAILKDELLPPSVLWSSSASHVSLVETYRWQLARTGNGSILDPSSDFRSLAAEAGNGVPVG